MRDRLEHEIELIKNDESMTPQEQEKEIRELEKDYRAQAREASERAYNEEQERW